MATQRPLVIFMVTNNYTPYSGGVVHALNAYAQELRALGHRVFIITLDFLGIPSPEEIDVIRIWSPVRFKYYKNYMAVPWRPTARLAQLAKQYKPDIIHTHHPFLLGASALKVAQQYAIPIAFTYHTIYERYLHYVPVPQWISHTLTKAWVSSFCDKVQALILPSNSLRVHLADQGIMHNISVIPSGILPHFIKPTFIPKQTKSGRFTLLTVSRFMPEKNISFLLDMYARLDQTHFELILIGYGAHLEALKKYAYSTLGLSEHALRFIIKPPKEELIKWYDTADLFIFASKSETQGLVLAEAMARGTPVIALQGTAIEDIVQNTYNGFIVHTKQEMGEKVISIWQDHMLHYNLQYAAWQTGCKYHPQQCALKLQELYNQLLEH